MQRPTAFLVAAALLPLCLAGCADGSPSPSATAAPAAAPAIDPELAAVQALTPIDACTWLTPERLRAVHPELAFEVRQRLEPRMSGYAWDSRCTYWAGVGTIEFAKDTPTHTVEIFVNTPASEAKALANMASRRERATSTTGYQPRPELGADAYAVTQTGMASLFFVKQGSEVQINVSDLDSPNADKIRRAVALAQSL